MKPTPDTPGTSEVPAVDHDVDAFLRHLRTERQLSPRTLEAYAHDLQQLGLFRHERKLSSWDQLSSAQLRHYVAQQHQRGISPRSLQRQLSTVRSFYRYLLREQRCQINPALDLRAPKAGKKLPKTLDADLASQLLDDNGDPDWRYGIRRCWSYSIRPVCACRSWLDSTSPIWTCNKARYGCSARVIKPACCPWDAWH